MSLPEGSRLAPGERERIEEGLEHLAKDVHAPRDINVRVVLHIHREYPKHVTVGKDDEGNPVVEIVNNAEEEAALTSTKKLKKA